MASNYFNRTKDKVKNRDTGYKNKLFMASKSAFTILAEPAAPFTNPGDDLRITADHTFPVGKGFYELYCTQDTVEAPGESGGDIGSKKMM